mmetsp:Transcript_17081/g.30608  ORF Transcript_17081/g.30608 Transcript_17081/m.30608 type:complete len:83 (+) Transcript_17081:584-832(+)
MMAGWLVQSVEGSRRKGPWSSNVSSNTSMQNLRKEKTTAAHSNSSVFPVRSFPLIDTFQNSRIQWSERVTQCHTLDENHQQQ